MVGGIAREITVWSGEDSKVVVSEKRMMSVVKSAREREIVAVPSAATTALPTPTPLRPMETATDLATRATTVRATPTADRKTLT